MGLVKLHIKGILKSNYEGGNKRNLINYAVAQKSETSLERQMDKQNRSISAISHGHL